MAAIPTPDTAVPRLVVVDDTDPTIQYSGAFSLDSTGLLDTQGFGGPVYNRTITGTTRNGSLSYNFKGSFVRAMVAATGFYSWNCSVDDHPIPSFAVNSSQLTNYVACDSAGILTGSTNVHTLDVNFFFSPDSPANSSLWLDSIQYQPLLSDPLDAVTLRIDNSDPSVVYSNSSGAWIQGAGSNGTVVNGASMSFTFNGSSASLYGINLGYPDFWNPTTAYYLIDGKLTDFDLPGSTTVASLGSRVASVINWPVFTIPNLSPSQHFLTVAAAFNTTNFPQGLIISYFIVKTDPVSSSAEGSSNSTSGSNSSTANPGPSESSGSDRPLKSTPVGSIVGGIVGGVVGIIAIILIIYLVRKRHRTTRYQGGMLDLSAGTPPSRTYYLDSNARSPMYSAAPSAPSYGETSTLAPRFSSQNSPHLLHNNYNSFGSAREDAAGMLQLHQNTPPVSPSGHRPSFVEFSPSMLYVQNQDANAPNSDSRSSSNGERLEFDPSRLVAMKTAQSNAVRDDQLRNTEVRLHADSGVRFTPSNRREVIDVPPTYTDA